MGKNFFTLILTIGAVFITTAAYADNLYYAKMAIGTGVSNKLNQEDYNKKRIKNSRIISIGIGKELGNNFDVDLTANFIDRQVFKHIIYSPSVLDGRYVTQKFSSRAILLNGTYNFCTPYVIHPYLSLGVGAAKNKAGSYSTYNSIDQIKSSQYGNRVNSFAYSFAGGVKYKIQPFELFLEYRHLNLGRFSTKHKSVAIDLTNHLTPITEYGPAIKTRIKYNAINIGIKVSF